MDCVSVSLAHWVGLMEANVDCAVLEGIVYALGGFAAGVVVCLLGVWLTERHFARRHEAELEE